MTAPAAAWHDVECGAYSADLALWQELASEHHGPVLDVGAGTGRVALALAAAGVDVTALDREDELLAVLRERVVGAPIATHAADARDFALDRRFAVIIVPMQTVQLLGGPAGRGAFLATAGRHLAAGGVLAAAIADPLEDFDGPGPDLGLPLPDVGEHEGLALTSQPLRVRTEDGAWVIERLRRAVDPRGRVVEEHDEIRLDALEPATLEDEGAAAGLTVERRRRVAETPEHVGSTVVVLSRA
jgi:SAM-dependent methyltransferase